MVRCADGSLYTGITTDIERRITEHNSSSLGAKYTKTRRPVTLVWCQKCANRSAASKREYDIKRMTKKAKENLIGSGFPLVLCKNNYIEETDLGCN